MPDRAGRYARLLAAVLEHAGQTEYALAKAAGIPAQTLARIRAGSVPRMDTVEKLLRAAGLDWAWVDEHLPRAG